MNKYIAIGRLTKEPEVKETKDGKLVASYTLAIDNGRDYDATFMRCVVFGRSAEFAEKYLEKGTKIAIVGRIVTGSYTDKEGNTRYTTDVQVESMEFAESKKSDDSSGDNRSGRNSRNGRR